MAKLHATAGEILARFGRATARVSEGIAPDVAPMPRTHVDRIISTLQGLDERYPVTMDRLSDIVIEHDIHPSKEFGGRLTHGVRNPVNDRVTKTGNRWTMQLNQARVHRRMTNEGIGTLAKPYPHGYSVGTNRSEGLVNEDLWQSITEHEFGHALYRAIPYTVEGGHDVADDLLAKAAGVGRFRNLTKVAERIDSEYGTYKPSEAVAEIFSYAQQSLDRGPRAMATLLGDLAEHGDDVDYRILQNSAPGDEIQGVIERGEHLKSAAHDKVSAARRAYLANLQGADPSHRALYG